MAYIFRSPTSSSISRASRCFAQSRQFHHCARRAAIAQQVMRSSKMKPQKSLRVQSQESEVPNDLGLFPGTFVRPTGDNVPSLFRDFKSRFRLERFALISRFQGIRSLLGFKFSFRRGVKPRLSLDYWKRSEIAKDLYEQMYRAFAAGDLTKLDDMCAEGLYNNLRNRIAGRSPRERVTWTLHRYLGRPRVVSDKFSKLPVPGVDQNDPKLESGLRQVVVNIRSLQTLKKSTVYGKGKSDELQEQKPDDSKQKVVNEYFIIQKRILKGKEEKWLVWGTTQEATVEDISRLEKELMQAGA